LAGSSTSDSLWRRGLEAGPAVALNAATFHSNIETIGGQTLASVDHAARPADLDSLYLCRAPETKVNAKIVV
jgi:hypothetical protein